MSAQTPVETTTIEVRPNGPYRVSGLCRLRNARGEEVPARATFALCRCGNSSNKPFCDGTHAKIAFYSARFAVGPRPDADPYRGKRITIHDNRAVCAHAGLCTDNLPKVFRYGQEPWVDPEGATVEEIIHRVQSCPSGALSYSIEGAPPAAVSRERGITASSNGPYFVTGEIKLEAGGPTPLFADRYALCRCGGSKNKPFCDGTHWSVGFDETRGRQAGVFVPPLGVKRFGLLAGTLLIGGAAAAVVAIKVADKATAPALGPAGLLYDLNVLLNLLVVAGLTFGYWLAKRGNVAGHRYNQTIWALLNAVLVGLIMVWSLADVKPTAMSDFAKPQVLVAWVHAALGTATIGCSLWLVLQMNGLLPDGWRVRGWKTLMRVTLAGYWLTALLGLVIYYFWFM